MKKLLYTFGSLTSLPIALTSVSCTFHGPLKEEYISPTISDLNIWEENIPEEQQKINIIVNAFEDKSIIINDTIKNQFDFTKTKKNILKVVEEQLKNDETHLKKYKDLINHYSIEDAYYLFRVLRGSLNPSNLIGGSSFLKEDITTWPEYQFLTKPEYEHPLGSDIFKYIVQSKVLDFNGIKNYLVKKYTPVSVQTGEVKNVDYENLMELVFKDDIVESQDNRFNFMVFFGAAYLKNTFKILGQDASLWSLVSEKVGGADTVKYILNKSNIPIKIYEL